MPVSPKRRPSGSGPGASVRAHEHDVRMVIPVDQCGYKLWVQRSGALGAPEYRGHDPLLWCKCR